jgi:hypothetical protein
LYIEPRHKPYVLQNFSPSLGRLSARCEFDYHVVRILLPHFFGTIRIYNEDQAMFRCAIYPQDKPLNHADRLGYQLLAALHRSSPS